ncbi:MAG: hypothetical protein E2O39_02355 [Planctomycetota bacterium]|nr:MAG: hypothetical protein E2O39_02355 [Planctomycetota bacterium]
MQKDASRSGGSEDPPLQPERIERPESLPGGSGEHDAGARPVARDGRGRRRFSASQRRELLAALEVSGQTVAEFADARGLNATTLHTWVRTAQHGTARGGEAGAPAVHTGAASDDDRSLRALGPNCRGVRCAVGRVGPDAVVLAEALRRGGAQGSRGSHQGRPRPAA